jgi:hypothetical protein
VARKRSRFGFVLDPARAPSRLSALPRENFEMKPGMERVDNTAEILRPLLSPSENVDGKS